MRGRRTTAMEAVVPSVVLAWLRDRPGRSTEVKRTLRKEMLTQG